MLYLSVLMFAAIYGAALYAWGVPDAAAVLYGVASLVCLLVYYLDKAAAKAGRWRISERLLLLLGLAGGWPGAALAQQWFRHKSSKPSFRAKFWATAVLNTGVFAYLVSPYSVSGLAAMVPAMVAAM